MPSRDWLSFTAVHHYRRESLYSGLDWSAKYEPGHFLDLVEMVAVGPFGDGVAFLWRLLEPSVTGSALMISFFNSAAEWLMNAVLDDARYGNPIDMCFTKETELCVLTDAHVCVFYHYRILDKEEPLGPTRVVSLLPSPPRQAAQQAGTEGAADETAPTDSGTTLPASAGTATSSLPAAGGPAIDLVAADPDVPAVLLHRLSPDGVVTVDAEGCLRAAIHEERRRTTVVAPHTLTYGGGDDMDAATDPRHLTALEFLPAELNEEGDMVVFCGLRPDGPRKAAGVCAGTVSVSGSSGSVVDRLAHLRLPEQAAPVLIRLCLTSPDRLAILTQNGTLLVVSTSLDSVLYSIVIGGSVESSSPDVSPQFSQSSPSFVNNESFSAFNATFAGFPSNATFAFTPGDPAAAALSPDPLLLPPPPPPPLSAEWCGRHGLLLQYADAGNNTEVGDERRRFADFCVLVHIPGGADGEDDYAGPAAKSMSPPVLRRVARLDGATVLGVCPEVDGARLVTTTGCDLLQRVPDTLVRLHHGARRLPSEALGGGKAGTATAAATESNPAFATAQAVLRACGGASSAAAVPATALSAPDGGSRQQRVRRFVAIREALSGCRDVAAVFGVLLDAASAEVQPSGQMRMLIAAASLKEAVRLPEESAETLVDVTRRLRMLRCVREAPGCRMPLTVAQYSAMGGITGGDLLDGGDGACAPRRLVALEAQVLVDRLVFHGHFQLALDVSEFMGMRTARVLSAWAGERVRDTSRSDAEVREMIRAALIRHPGVGFLDAAGRAFQLGRHQLALWLLRDEPAFAGKIMLLLQSGNVQRAPECAADSHDADLVHLSLITCLLQQRRERERRRHQEMEEEANAAGEEDAARLRRSRRRHYLISADFAETLICSPALLSTLLGSAHAVPLYREAVDNLCTMARGEPLLSTLSTARQLCVCLRGELGAAERLLTTLREVLASQHVRDRAATEAATAAAAAAAAASQASKKKSKSSSKKRNAKDDAAAEEGDAGDDDGADDGASDKARDALFQNDELDGEHATAANEAALLENCARSLPVRKPTLSESAVLCEQHLSSLIVSCEASRAACGKHATRRVMPSPALSSALRTDSGYHRFFAAPGSTPAESMRWMQQQQRLEEVKQHYAEKFGDSLFTTAVSVTDVVKLLVVSRGARGESEVKEACDSLRTTFGVSEKKMFYTRFVALCEANLWPEMEALVGPPPPLQKKFFSSSGPVPCIGYLPIVEYLFEHGQPARAAVYVPGVSPQAVTRVEWYMRMSAPVMALEAAAAAEDAGLIQQILSRPCAQVEKVQRYGAQLLKQLKD